MARTRWPPDPENPGLLPRPGRSDRQRRWVPQNLGPADKSILKTARAASADSEVRPGPRPPTLRPHHSKAREAGPEALTHILPAEYERPRQCPVHRGSAPQNSQFGRCRIRERPGISPARSAGFGGSVPVHDRHGHLRARPDARMGSIRTLKRQLAHGWVSDWSSLRAWVVWARV